MVTIGKTRGTRLQERKDIDCMHIIEALPQELSHFRKEGLVLIPFIVNLYIQ